MRAFCVPSSVGAMALLLALPRLAASDVQPQPFTVADSIQMTRIVDPELPDLNWLPSKEPKFKRSPDGRKILMVLRRGNLQTGMNDYTLASYDTANILSLVNSSPGTLASADVLARFSTDGSDDAIDQVVWMPDGNAVAFIGREAGRPAQVYVVELDSKRIVQMTHDEGEVVRFAMSPDRKVVVYAARVVPDISAKLKYGYTVTTEMAWNLGASEGDDVYPFLYRYFIVRAGSKPRAVAALEPTWFPQHISVSPSGEWAVIAHPIRHPPPVWRNYEFIRQRLAREREAVSCDVGEPANSEGRFNGENFFGSLLSDVALLYLVELKSADAKPLVAAPVVIPATEPDTKFGGWDRGSIEWSPDGTRVLLPPNLLPLDVSDAAERKRREKALAIYTVDLSSRAVRVVADLTPYMSTENWELMPIVPYAMEISGRWLDSSTLTLDIGAPDGDPGARSLHRLRAGSWISERARPREESSERLRLHVKQDMNTPPNVVATDSETRRSAAVTDLNPQLRDLTLARVQMFEWADRLGARRTGGLFVPPGMTEGVRFPLVIQLGGFIPQEFQVDGPGVVTTAQAAQALANAGMLVLQAPDFWHGSSPEFGCTRKAQPRSVATESDQVIAGIEGAIEALDAAGFIDRNRVGLLGFSRTGMNVHSFVAFSQYPIAAATVADSVAMTPTNYAWAYGAPFPGMLEFETDEIMGAPFWGAGIDLWRERSYLFHLDRIDTPIRYEQNYAVASPQWDAYAILKRMQRPVEFIHFPINKHILQTPHTRYTSQQGNVDWFTFWLKGQERTPNDIDAHRPDPDLSGQYRRWRKLKDQHERVKRTRGPDVSALSETKSSLPSD